MDPVPFAINHQIFMGFTTLTPEEREAVKAAIAPLMDHMQRDWPAHGAIRLASPDPLYLLRVDPSLRHRPAHGRRTAGVGRSVPP